MRTSPSANGALCETLGYGEEELLHKSLQEITHPDDLAKDGDLERQVLGGTLNRYAVEKRLYHRDGHIVWVVLSVALVRDREQAPLYFIGQMLDITPRKTMEQELIESRTRLRELAAHHEAVREEERKRIALEIHDELGQLLTALKMDISLLRMQFGIDPGVSRRTSDMRELVEKTIGVVRQVASNLRPAALNLGIGPALEWLVEDFGQRTGIAYELNLSGGEIDLDDMRATAVFRIVQESLTNVMRHAAASSVAVSLRREGETLQLEVRDDGRGFDYEAASHGPSFGLLGIRERVRGLGGSLSVDSRPGLGTTVSIHIPHVSERPT
jgi:PAS domain S-box-containing protein